MKIPLKKQSGLPMSLSGERVEFAKSVRHARVVIRRFNGSERFFSGHPVDKSKPLYYIYRNVRFPKHTALFEKQEIRYDITVLGKNTQDREASRTIGHIHKKIGKAEAPSELYRVLFGKAIFYLQHRVKKQARYIYAPAGTDVFIPGDFGHITINASNEPLVIANLFTNREHSSDYNFFRKTHGPAFFPVWNGKKIIFVKNQRVNGYAIKKEKTGKAEKRSLYARFIGNPKKFLFLG